MIDLTTKYVATTEYRLADTYKTIPTIPKGFEVVGYRPAKKGEYVLCTNGSTYPVITDFGPTSPVICLRRQKCFIFRPTGYHCPNNEFTRGYNGNFYRTTSNYPEECYSMEETEI
jgi:hypothetical protein